MTSNVLDHLADYVHVALNPPDVADRFINWNADLPDGAGEKSGQHDDGR
jgi:hypothetical protein